MKNCKKLFFMLFLVLLTGCTTILPISRKITVIVDSEMEVGNEYFIDASAIGFETDLVFEISNTDIASINNNVITTIKEGTFELIVSSVEDETIKTIVEIKVKEKEIIKQQYNISYNVMGHGETPSDVINVTNIPELLPILTFEGYKFIGWYTDNEYKNEVELGSVISSDVVLYAKWEEVITIPVEVQNIIDLITKLPSVITLEIESEIENIESKYNNLTPDDKKLVTNYVILLNAIGELSELKIIDIDSYIPNILIEDIILPKVIEGKQVEWISSDNNLFKIVNDKGLIQRAKQNYQNQKITISMIVTDGGNSEIYNKDTLVSPIKFEKFSSTPVAAYVNSGAMPHYISNNGRSETFSDAAKEILDIVYYCFIYPQTNGEVSITNEFLAYYDDVIALRETGTRVVVSVAGTSVIFSDLCSDVTLREKFATSLVNCVKKYNFDGIDIDWEFPGVNTNRSDAVDSANYTSLLKLLREKLNALQDSPNSTYLLTAAVPGTSWGTNHYDFEGLNTYLDYVNMMSYDLNRTNLTTHISPLYTSSNDKGYGFSVKYGADRFISLGLEQSKIIIGCATYGKTYKVNGTIISTDYPGLGVSGSLIKVNNISGSFASGTIYYHGILQLIKQGGYVVYIDKNNNDQVSGSYIYNSNTKIFVSYESSEIFYLKYKYALDNKMGIMCWSLPEDATDTYINTIYNYK